MGWSKKGAGTRLQFGSVATDEEIGEVESRLGVRLPEELRMLLQTMGRG